MSMLTGPCPQCGKGLQIPEDLQEFSCMYCGVRLTRDQLLCDGADALLAKLCEAMGPCLTDHPDTIQSLMPKKYPQRYESYALSCGSLLKAINDLPSDRHAALAEALLQHIDGWVQENKKPLRSADALLEDVKYTVCLLFVPAVREAAPWQGLSFCQTFREKWLARYPKQQFQLTSYRDIAEGFDRKKLCFITTAVCAYQGKPDNCEELTAFRTFRDGWLSAQPDGKALISEYYRIAPGIVTAISLTDPHRVYPHLWQAYLKPCFDAITKGDFAACKAIYTHMVRTLTKEYPITKE